MGWLTRLGNLCGFIPPDHPDPRAAVTYKEFSAKRKKFFLLTDNLEGPPNSVSTAYMFKPTPKLTRWYVTRFDGVTYNQARYMFGLAFTDWKMLPLQCKEAPSAAEATVHVELTTLNICGSPDAIGCYTYFSDKPSLLQVRRDLYDPSRPLAFVETAVHEYGHHLGLDDGYSVTPCGGGVDYLGAMGFGEGSFDRLGTRPSLHERSVVKRSAILKSFPRCS